jgi:hypothetical protein
MNCILARRERLRGVGHFVFWKKEVMRPFPDNVVPISPFFLGLFFSGDDVVQFLAFFAFSVFSGVVVVGDWLPLVDLRFIYLISGVSSAFPILDVSGISAFFSVCCGDDIFAKKEVTDLGADTALIAAFPLNFRELMSLVTICQASPSLLRRAASSINFNTVGEGFSSHLRPRFMSQIQTGIR